MQRILKTVTVGALVIIALVPVAPPSYCETEPGIFVGLDSGDASEQLEGDPGLYFLMAEQAEARGDTDKVIYYYRKALSLDPTSAYLNVRIGTLLARNRKIADALIMARLATIFDPKYEEA
ncbi:MAG: hypothetical protein P8182_00845 [Deltaproteobacteria bacterium]